MNVGLQSRFLKHESCPNCGSRDNLARYSNGSGFCFGCGRYERGEHLPHERLPGMEGKRKRGTVESEDRVRPPPDDLNTHYEQVVIEWIKKYHLTASDLVKHNVKWSPSREQLVYLFYGAGKDVVLWQARNFREGTTHKSRFFTGGTPADVIAAYYPEQATDTAVIVEDCVSGIKCAGAGYVGVPCFSAAMPKAKLAQLARMYSRCYIWLDEDKLKEAQKLAQQAAFLGMESRVIYTPKDPKEYEYESIRHRIQSQ